MKKWFHSWRAALRIARRDAWRSKGRSFLVLAMIALPIMGVSAADLTLRSAELSTTETLEREMGAADARLSSPSMGGEAIFQAPDARLYEPARVLKENEPYPEGPTDVRKAAPKNARLLPDTVGRAKLETEHGLLATEVRELKATDPMAAGIMDLTEGRFPAQEGEVAATTAFLKKSGLKVGGKLTARHLDREYRITGAYELPSSLKTDQINALPGAFIKPLNEALKKAELGTDYGSTTYLAAVEGGFTWNMVKETNTRGVIVDSRAVTLSKPADSEVPLYQKPGFTKYSMDGPGFQAEELTALATVVSLALLEICLLAGPAFAVGARRSRRQLGLVGANGGERSHIRAIVLAGGLVLGAAAAVIGTTLGVVLSITLQGTFEEMMDARFGAFDARPLELLGIALLAVFTGTMAALVPAVTSSRQSVLSSLTGRRGIRRSSRVLPVIGLIAVALGATIALAGSLMLESFVIVGAGAIIAELGIVALTPVLVGLFGRLGGFLPLSPRLALRDAVRNRGRTAPAVAAVLAAVAGTVAVATYAASDEAQQKAAYTAQAPHGSVIVTDENSRDVPAIRTAVQRTIPVGVRADVDRLVVGKSTCAMYDDDPACGRYVLMIPQAKKCPLYSDGAVPNGEDPAARFTVEQRRALAKDWRCKNEQGPYQGEVVVADEKLLKVLGIKNPAAEQALKSGKAITFKKQHVGDGGTVNIKVVTDIKAADKALETGKEEPGVIKSFPVHEVTGDVNAWGFQTVLPPAALKSAGAMKAVPYGSYVLTDGGVADKDLQKLEDELSRIGTSISLSVEKGYESDTSIVLVALAAFAALITIGAAGIATGLSQADAEADLKTLAAVGAPPRVRRTLSGFQCGVVATMGVVLGTAAGVLPAVGLLLTERRDEQSWYEDALNSGYEMPAPYVPIIMPWETLGALLVVVPLGAVLLAALMTRSRGALARRETT
ncbi:MULTISPECIES: ABC transporter permease family protein [Streptomyces]|uniref:ABC transporter permease n=1 Tax=Streptomyces tsukubensis (strain DSM 42081 / NBRC 108919 / NRRL 18488 / 9993) TaxID=1114943 RepID=I2N269_STRT9|nr:ABC transporter permease [Streptomyces tsukubensis]MYS62887.1 FtsX-like permease family protein [Streptomyces sp. SID5473]AZK95263.1 ABC transporter permease [Streptomyces tsukubensis]EIF91116.1 hypothetical protein [Streptomyces tsukubensis NRRL18488]QKM68680.1 ABC transporter permease [Streptomyces tsukubensis NRRL18488]TAI43487.1 ABC transporter permease [Streptomyces tsukubensis]